jgi:glutathione S-transferase
MAPTVVYGDQILVESGAIIEMMMQRHAGGKLAPALDSDDFPEYQMWMHYAEGSLAARLFSDYRAWRIQPPTARSPLVDSEAVVQFAENFLADNEWFGGSVFSAADIMMLFPLNVATTLALVDVDSFPHVADWKMRVEARPAYQRMLAAARPDGMIGSLPKIEQRPPAGPR